MQSDQEVAQSTIDEVFSLLKKGNTKKARLKLGVPSDAVTDEEFLTGMISLEKGINLFAQGRQPEAIAYLQNAVPIINKSTNENDKILINTITNFAEGITKLLAGDAHGALPLLNVSTHAMEQLSFFMPGFQKIAISYKAASYIALARVGFNTGDLSATESWLGKARDQHQQLLALLDPENMNDIPGFVEVFATSLEFANVFAFFDIQALELDGMEKRLQEVSEDAVKLQQFVEKMEYGPIQNVARVTLMLYAIFKEFHTLEKDIILNRLPVNKDRIEKLYSLAQKLFDAEELAKKAGERGKGFLTVIQQLERIRKNLLLAGKVGKEDFGRFAGIISLCSLVVLMIIVELAISPSGFSTYLYFLGELIISLVAGFGYGAIRFKPLLKLYSEAVKEQYTGAITN